MTAAAAGAVRQFKPPREGARKRPQMALPYQDASWWVLAKLDSALVSAAEGTSRGLVPAGSEAVPVAGLAQPGRAPAAAPELGPPGQGVPGRGARLQLTRAVEGDLRGVGGRLARWVVSSVPTGQQGRSSRPGGPGGSGEGAESAAGPADACAGRGGHGRAAGPAAPGGRALRPRHPGRCGHGRARGVGAGPGLVHGQRRGGHPLGRAAEPASAGPPAPPRGRGARAVLPADARLDGGRHQPGRDAHPLGDRDGRGRGPDGDHRAAAHRVGLGGPVRRAHRRVHPHDQLLRPDRALLRAGLRLRRRLDPGAAARPGRRGPRRRPRSP